MHATERLPNKDLHSILKYSDSLVDIRIGNTPKVKQLSFQDVSVFYISVYIRICDGHCEPQLGHYINVT